MVALTAIGMFWTTTTHAAPVDNSMTSVYGNTPPTSPGTPTVPSPTGTNLQVSSDVQVTFFTHWSQNGAVDWKYLVQNIGAGVAPEVAVQGIVIRSGGVQLGEDSSWQSLGDMAPGAMKYVTVSCKPKTGRPACASSVATAFLKHELNAYPYANDVNPYNNQAKSS
jgi:hypothetical protein